MLKKLLRSSDLGENYAVERIAVEDLRFGAKSKSEVTAQPRSSKIAHGWSTGD
jgi:hypothetical protein